MGPYNELIDPVHCVAARRLLVLMQTRMRRMGTAALAFFSLGSILSLKEKKQFFNTSLEAQGSVSGTDEPSESSLCERQLGKPLIFALARPFTFKVNRAHVTSRPPGSTDLPAEFDEAQMGRLSLVGGNNGLVC